MKSYLSSRLRFLVLAGSLLLISGSLWATGSNLERLGDAAYQRRNYDSAINYFSRAAADKSAPAAVLYKLGNAHYRLHHVAEAMLAYERALLRQPAFPAAAHNATLIQKQVSPAAAKEVFFLRWWQALTAASLSNLWAFLAISLFAGLLLTLGWRQYKRLRMAWLRPQVTGGLLVLVLLMAIFSFAGVQRHTPKAAGIVMRPDVRFQSAVSGSATGGLSLPEGLLVTVLHKEKNGYIVRLPDGQEGIVQGTDIAVVE
ncbi:MAG: tetratricopeptide repeat protein [Bacteroidetes bacterium]|nr:tetratricopeptide repeat protein [Bacteroidota bacterium]MBS1628697.1 tetratricopeptide repeat protein [Bacteroidota bacterium]